MLKHRIRRSLAAVLGAALTMSPGLGVSNGSTFPIDTFDDATNINLSPIPTPPSLPFTTPSTPANLTQTAVDGVSPAVTLGGERYIAISGGGYTVPNARKQVAANSLTFFIPNVSNADPSFFTLLLDYGRTTPLTDGAGGINFGTLGGSVTVGVTTATSPQGVSANLKVTIESGDHAGGAIATGSFNQSVLGPGNFSFPFSHPGFASVDFSDVTQVTVLLEDLNIDGGSYVISGITREAVVPEPATLALSLLGLGVVALRRRQR
ncbi:PEP-CTERM sorting domain-containing protein [Lacipirellula parvula]|uniref:Ice-binding protein C-terminal domain-containing protein n=1 Tax=Lacipirellula parvula TaxID=2650471 RepID=A0A5K7XFQ2_9BACT|nr:PEP-CTERM sorting domain-containing protein [Lacipirellula parvula]BBO31799.1 hypothetical protein PLANPX_1411 [Lacipirellula parvula]